MNCLYFNHKLNKKIPCKIIPGELLPYRYRNSFSYLCAVTYEGVDLVPYDIDIYQLNKYCEEYIDIHDIYPAIDQLDIDYFNDCIDNKTVDRFKELKRYEHLYTLITDVDDISVILAYQLCNFIITDLQFKYLTHEEKLFMRSISEIIYTEKPEIIPVIEFIRMIKLVFDKYQGNEIYDTHIIDNVNNIINYNYVFPLTLNVVNIKQNVNFLLQ